MATCLTTAFKDKDKVKALGARFDGQRRQWYVPDGVDLEAFERWLPSGTVVPAQATANDSELAAVAMAEASVRTEVAAIRGIPLSKLLAGVAQAVAAAYRTGVWTTVEVSKVDVRRGHVYLELAERDAQGSAVAQARAMIWAHTANVIVPEFEAATGAVLGPGIKLLVRAKPTMHALYGLSLVIDAIDSDYTLGDLEARKKEIRSRLQREGLFERNRQLPRPWDYTTVLVVAPEGAAGLGDFRAEGDRLQHWGICHFHYAFSRFQGEGAAAEIVQAATDALATRSDWDAVIFIRGGGAVNDLAWLNDYTLTRWICECPVPVHTGIGHERDSTVLDEVANQRFDTPSKVIHGLETVICRRATEARANFDAIVQMARQQAQAARHAVDQANTIVRQAAQRQVHRGRALVVEHLGAVRHGAHQAVRDAADRASGLLQGVRHQASTQLATAQRTLPALLADIRAGARQAVKIAGTASAQHLQTVVERARLDAACARQAIVDERQVIETEARRQVSLAREHSQALMREVAGQGPDKTMRRGFAVVRAGGQAVTSAEQLQGTPDAPIDIQFHDGHVQVHGPVTRTRTSS